MNQKPIIALIIFLMTLTILVFNTLSDVYGCRCGGSRQQYTFISPSHLPSNAKGVVVDFKLPYSDTLWNRNNNVILNFLTRKRRASDFVVKDLSTNKRIRTKVVKLNAKELKPHFFKTRYYLFTKKFYKQCLEDHKSEVKSRSKQCKRMRRILSKYPNDWVSRLLKQRILKEVTKKVHRRYGLYRIEPLHKFLKERRYQFSAKGRYRYSNVYIDSKPMRLEHIENIRMNFDQPIQYTYMKNVGRGGSCSSWLPTVVKPIEYELHKDLKPFSKYLISTLMLKDYSEKWSNDSESFFRPWTHRYSSCSSRYGYTRAVVNTSLNFDCTGRETFAEGKLRFNELSAEVKAVFGMLEIEDRLYVTQAQTFAVNQKQFENCLELKKDTQ